MVNLVIIFIFLLIIQSNFANDKSEQQIVDCAGSNGCNGGNAKNAWNYIVGTGGQDTSSYYPYIKQV